MLKVVESVKVNARGALSMKAIVVMFDLLNRHILPLMVISGSMSQTSNV